MAIDTGNCQDSEILRPGIRQFHGVRQCAHMINFEAETENYACNKPAVNRSQDIRKSKHGAV